MGKKKQKQNNNQPVQAPEKDNTTIRLVASVLVLALIAGLVYAGYVYDVFGTIKQALFPPEVEVSAEVTELSVHILDVGEGSAALIESDGRYGLIDGGPREKSSFVVAYLKQLGIESLDFVIVSHYDADHLSGAVGVINVFKIDKLYAPGYVSGTSIYQSFIASAGLKGLVPISPEAGDSFSFGSSTVTFIGPSRYDHYTENDNSIVVKVSNGSSSFLFTGDAEREAEKEMLASGEDLRSTVLIVGHHGSSSSTSEPFFVSVLPEYAVISCSSDNSYGHPSKAVIDILRRYGTKVYRTDEHGTVVATCTGRNISWSCDPSDSWSYRTADRPSSSPDYTGAYILNTHSMVFHLPTCTQAEKMSERNKALSVKSRDELIAEGYSPCGYCRP
ncbi:MAG: MBL fold metallo-hydrolase [Oscillospiraceae bacterium]|nr:MBL fold metallo-hydrolase [Oscillospiraceae bacterium]